MRNEPHQRDFQPGSSEKPGLHLQESWSQAAGSLEHDRVGLTAATSGRSSGREGWPSLQRTSPSLGRVGEESWTRDAPTRAPLGLILQSSLLTRAPLLRVLTQHGLPLGLQPTSVLEPP